MPSWTASARAAPSQRETPGGGDRRRGLGRTDQRPLRAPLVRRRRSQQRFQRPARPNLAGAADRAVGARQAVPDRPGHRACHHRRDYRRWLPEGLPRGGPLEPAARDRGGTRGRGARARHRSIAGACRRGRPQSRRVHCAATRTTGPGDPGAGRRDPRGQRAPGFGRQPAARPAAPPTALQRRRPGNGARVGALLPSAARRRGQSGPGAIRHSGCLRAPHRPWLDRRNQSGHRAAGARQSKLRQFDFARARSRHAAHPTAGGALADAQPRNPQRNA